MYENILPLSIAAPRPDFIDLNLLQLKIKIQKPYLPKYRDIYGDWFGSAFPVLHLPGDLRVVFYRPLAHVPLLAKIMPLGCLHKGIKRIPKHHPLRMAA